MAEFRSTGPAIADATPGRPATAVGTGRRRLGVLSGALLGVLSGALLGGLTTGCSTPPPPASSQSPSPNILLIVIDTLGAKHVGAYDSSLDTTPNLDSLAAAGSLFTNAYSTAPWTMPSVASMFTGVYPSAHRVLRFGDSIDGATPTLANRLLAGGFRTGAVVGNGLLRVERGFARGFESWELTSTDEMSALEVTDRAIDWLDRREVEAPFFLYLHYMDPHQPYLHHLEFDRLGDAGKGIVSSHQLGFELEQMEALTEEELALLRGLYQEEVAFTDDQIGRLLEHLNRSGLEESTVVVITGDHGEEFQEHGALGHGGTLHRELLHVPLIVRRPGSVPVQRIEAPVSLMDLQPTLLDLAGIGRESEETDGVSLAAMLRGDDRGSPDHNAERELFAETIWDEELPIVRDLPQPDQAAIDSGVWLAPPEPPASRTKMLTGVIDGDLKLVHDLINDWWNLYDHAEDPGEERNLFGGHDAEHELMGRLEAWERKTGAGSAERLAPPGEVKLGDEEIAHLRALGYL